MELLFVKLLLLVASFVMVGVAALRRDAFMALCYATIFGVTLANLGMK